MQNYIKQYNQCQFLFCLSFVGIMIQLLTVYFISYRFQNPTGVPSRIAHTVFSINVIVKQKLNICINMIDNAVFPEFRKYLQGYKCFYFALTIVKVFSKQA